MKDEELINEINRIGAKYAHEINCYFKSQIEKIPEPMPHEFLCYYDPCKKIYHLSAYHRHKGEKYSLWNGSINLKNISKINLIEPVFQFWCKDFKKSIDKKIEFYLEKHLEFIKNTGTC